MGGLNVERKFYMLSGRELLYGPTDVTATVASTDALAVKFGSHGTVDIHAREHVKR